MEHALKVTNVLSDPTRFNIYQFMIQHRHEVTVTEIADHFDIHPNVARMHLTKLQDINLLISYSKRTGKGGRPSRLYSLSEEVIELNFPHRDYKMFSIKIGRASCRERVKSPADTTSVEKRNRSSNKTHMHNTK